MRRIIFIQLSWPSRVAGWVALIIPISCSSVRAPVLVDTIQLVAAGRLAQGTAVHFEIMGGVVEVWSKHGIQIMVLFSLVLQLLLFAIPIARRHRLMERRKHLARLNNLVLWLAYQLADTTATYALGHMAIISSPSGERRQLMALWAALLLVHLGGQDTITAYALEDNRLWKRHLLTLLVQAAGVFYVIPVNRGSNPRLSFAAALMSILGVVKFAERIYVLRFSEDMNKVGDLVSLLAPPTRRETYTRRVALMQQEKALKLAHNLLEFSMGQFIDAKVSLSQYPRSIIMAHYDDDDTLYMLVELQLSLIHDKLYTKSPVIHTWLGCLIRAFSWLATAVIGTMLVFHFVRSSSSRNYSGGGFDAAVTLTLLAGAFLLETASLLKAAGSTWTVQILDRIRWDGRMVLWFRRLVKAAESNRRWPGFIGIYEYVFEVIKCDWDFSSSIQKIEPDTKRYVLGLIRRMVHECRGDEEKLRISRGGLSLQRLPVPPQLIQNKITHNEFDESFFIWTFVSASFVSHPSILHMDSTNPLCGLRDAINQISGYMDYLLKKKPHMLPPPVRHRLKYRIIYERENGGKNDIYQELIRGGFTEAKLEGVLGVWVEMLCYAASYCNRESHARELSNGSGEFITIVWLLRAALFKASNPDDDDTQESEN
ncbi:hypothetical protein GQ55_6G055100 [Panicum hallii var. hallii]|uniref:DUF4220 domain-containing protein n=1 Tax=Panicum hallii var. hallii TaxID=1504633 RepID=A0A2T7D484_9POAL|nr:hypothetical protein GQ55_6G055100 [Panicum hallii var. hallii]